MEIRMPVCERYQDFDVYSDLNEKQFRYVYITQNCFYNKLCKYLLSPSMIKAHASVNLGITTDFALEDYREIYDRLIQFIDLEKIFNIDDILDPAIKKVLDEELIASTADLRKDKWGRIGEYIFNVLLDTYFELDCIIRKFALNTSPNMPVYGIDTVHCSLKNKCIYFGESKCVSSLANGVALLNKSLEEYEAQIEKEFFTITNQNFRRSQTFLDVFSNEILTCFSFREFIEKAQIKSIGIPVFVAHAGTFDVNTVFAELRKIKKQQLFGLETSYIVISFPIVDKENFRTAFIYEANTQLEEMKKCIKQYRK